jgi:hypothetical protein
MEQWIILLQKIMSGFLVTKNIAGMECKMRENNAMEQLLELAQVVQMDLYR